MDQEVRRVAAIGKRPSKETSPRKRCNPFVNRLVTTWRRKPEVLRSEEHTSELQSRLRLVCRLQLEKKKKNEQKLSILQSLKIKFKLCKPVRQHLLLTLSL